MYEEEEISICRRFRKGTKIYSTDWNAIAAWERDEGPKPVAYYHCTIEYRKGNMLKIEGSPAFDFTKDLSFGYAFMTGELSTNPN